MIKRGMAVALSVSLLAGAMSVSSSLPTAAASTKRVEVGTKGNVTINLDGREVWQAAADAMQKAQPVTGDIADRIMAQTGSNGNPVVLEDDIYKMELPAKALKGLPTGLGMEMYISAGAEDVAEDYTAAEEGEAAAVVAEVASASDLEATGVAEKPVRDFFASSMFSLIKENDEAAPAGGAAAAGGEGYELNGSEHIYFVLSNATDQDVNYTVKLGDLEILKTKVLKSHGDTTGVIGASVSDLIGVPASTSNMVRATESDMATASNLMEEAELTDDVVAKVVRTTLKNFFIIYRSEETALGTKAMVVTTADMKFKSKDGGVFTTRGDKMVLAVRDIDKNSEEYKQAAATLQNNNVDHADFAAVDISFRKGGADEDYEPCQGQIVNVRIETKAIENFDPESMSIQHHLDDGSLETVAGTTKKTVVEISDDAAEAANNTVAVTEDQQTEITVEKKEDENVYTFDEEANKAAMEAQLSTAGKSEFKMEVGDGETALTNDVKESGAPKKASAAQTEVKKNSVTKTISSAVDANGVKTEVQEEQGNGDIKVEDGKVVADFVVDSFSIYTIVGQNIVTVDYLSADGNTYTVSVDLSDANIPEGAYLQVEELSNSAAEEYVEKAAKAVNKKVDDLYYSKALDISIIYNNEKIQPDGTVNVEVTLQDKEKEVISEVVHFGDKTEVLKSSTDGNTVQFKTDGFSVFAIVGTTLTAEHMDHNGYKYDVTVTYGPEAKIPEGSKLSVTDIEEGTDAYEYARNAVLADKQAKGEAVFLPGFGLAALDISILNPEGEEIEPAAPVRVDIKIKSLPNVEVLNDVANTIEIQHHVETGNKVVVDTVYDGGATDAKFDVAPNKETIAEGKAVDPNSYVVNEITNDTEDLSDADEIDASFETELFSTYTISYNFNNYSKRVHYVDTNGNSLTPTMTPNFDARHQFLIYDIEGYEYDSTHVGSRTGTSIAPILRANSEYGLYYSGNIQYRNGNNWSNLNNDDIYVVYKQKTAPTAGGTPEVDEDETWPDQEDPARKPQFTKSSTNNGNNTNNISLTITAPEKPVSKSTPADVIVVFDVSGSMSEYMGNQRRLAAAKTAVNNMANTLLNGQNSNVRMALISFSTTAQQVNITGATDGFTSNYSNFSSAVNGLTADGGTNWEKALQLANQMQVRSDAATFVVFVTDGDPTFRVSRGNVSDSNLDLYTSSTYQYYRNNQVFGTGSSDNYGRNFDFAVDQVSAIAGANKNFYAIGISTDVTKVQNLTTQGGVAADHAFIASNTQAMENAFKSITESIKATLGFGNVEMTDGITALTNAEMKVMQTVDPNSFKYYRYGGENNKYGNGYANKTEWATREADGCAAASYSESDGAVHWDMGETFQLENGVTYVVEFTVWPSQAAYDLVADLNNGLKTYASLTDAEKAQVVELTAPTETTTGTYALKTNTDEVNATYNRTTKTGDTVSISDTADVEAEYHEGTIQNMSLDSDYITVKKVWHNALDYHVADGITLTVTKDGASYLDDVTLNDKNSWTSDEQYISTGFITKTSDGKYNVRETGHDYTVTEPASFSYYWDLTADTYRPMVIEGELKMLIKTDNPTGTEGTDYYVIGGKNYQVSTTTTPQLTASNDRRSNLNLKKLVTANTQAVDNVPNPDDIFTYTITIADTNGDAVWFGAQDASGTTVLIDSHSANVTAAVDEEGNPTGSYSVPSGSEFTISIKAGWNVRFFNLPKGTTYAIQETGMVGGYEFVKAETSAKVTDPTYADDFVATPGTVSGNSVTGTIDQPNNVYSTEYTNNWNPNNEIVIIKTDENDAKLAGAKFTLYKKADEWKEIETFTSSADAGETLKVGHGLYKLEETTAPTDYYSRKDTVYFKVVTSGNTTTVVLTNENGEEIDAAELPSVYPDAAASGNEVTVKNWPLTTAEAQKAWKNADGTTTAPANATVVYTLYIDGEASNHTVTLDGTADAKPSGTDVAGYERAGWTATFINLPKYKFVEGVKTEIDYTIAETTTYPGYTASTTAPVANGGTVTNTQEATTANATKAWKNADGSTTAPEAASVVFTLYADGTATDYTVTLDGTVDTAPTGTGGYENEAWKATFVNLPRYQAGTTTEIVYTIAETTTYPGYTPSTTDPVASSGTITNTQGSTETFAVKAWKNVDGTTTPPAGATVVFTLYADGAETNYTVTLDGTPDEAPAGTGGYESEAWKATFVNLPQYQKGTTTPIVYTIAETTTYPGYTPLTMDSVGSGSTITNSQDPTTANAKKSWANADGTTTAPQGATVVFTLYADGTATKYTVTLDGTVDTEPEVTGGYESEEWKATFVNLPKYKAGTTTEIVYTVAETTTYPGYTASTTAPVASGKTITNTQEATEAKATKAWSNADGTTTPPTGATVEFTLYADGEVTEYKVTLDGTVDTPASTGTAGYESAKWEATFVNLPKYQAGTTTQIVYTIAESKTYPGYTPSSTEPVASGETITNTQEATTVNATKAWKNADDSTTSPTGATVEFTLYADGEATDYKVTLDGTKAETVPTGTAGYESEEWKATFVNLPKYQADGTTAIVYTIAETKGYEYYEMDPKTAVADGGTITNKQSTTKISVNKVVAGNLGNKTERFDFTLKLFKGDTVVSSDWITFDKAESTITDAKYNATDKVWEFKLSHNDKVTFANVPVGYTCKVEEADYAQSGYTTVYSIAGVNTNGAAVLADGLEVTVTNTKDSTIPTGIHTDSTIWRWLIGACFLMFFGSVLYGRRKRRQ